MAELSIPDSAKDLVDRIRSYSISQKNLWNLVPWLALEADGRTGFSLDYELAYQNGLWTVESTQQSLGYNVLVDLITGELLSRSAKRGRSLKTAEDHDVLELALCLEKLDAGEIIKTLVDQSKQPHGSYYNPKKQEEWRDKQRAKIKIKR